MKNKLRKILSIMLICCMLLSGSSSFVRALAEEASSEQAEIAPAAEEPKSTPEPKPEPEPTASEEKKAEPEPVHEEADEAQKAEEDAVETTPLPTQEPTKAPVEPTEQPANVETAEPAESAEATAQPETEKPFIESFDVSELPEVLYIEIGTPEDEIALPSTLKICWSDGTEGKIGVRWVCVDDGSGGSKYVSEPKNSQTVYTFQARLTEDALCNAQMPEIKLAFKAAEGRVKVAGVGYIEEGVLFITRKDVRLDALPTQAEYDKIVIKKDASCKFLCEVGDELTVENNGVMWGGIFAGKVVNNGMIWWDEEKDVFSEFQGEVINGKEGIVLGGDFENSVKPDKKAFDFSEVDFDKQFVYGNIAYDREVDPNMAVESAVSEESVSFDGEKIYCFGVSEHEDAQEPELVGGTIDGLRSGVQYAVFAKIRVGNDDAEFESEWTKLNLTVCASVETNDAEGSGDPEEQDDAQINVAAVQETLPDAQSEENGDEDEIEITVDYEAEKVTVKSLREGTRAMRLVGRGGTVYAANSASITARLEQLFDQAENTDETLVCRVVLSDGSNKEYNFQLKARPDFDGEDVSVTVSEVGEGTARLSCDSAYQSGLMSGNTAYWADESGLVTGMQPDSRGEYYVILRKRGSNAQQCFASKRGAALDENGETISVRLKDAFYVTLTETFTEDGLPSCYTAVGLDSAADSKRVVCSWYAVDMNGVETLLAETPAGEGTLRLTEEQQKAMFFRRMKVVAVDESTDEAVSDVSETVCTAGIEYELDYVKEEVSFVAAVKPEADCVLYFGEDGEHILWPANVDRVSVSLKDMGGIPTEINYFINHEASGTTSSTACLSVPSRPIPDGENLVIDVTEAQIVVSGILKDYEIAFGYDASASLAEKAEIEDGAALWNVEDGAKERYVFLKSPASNEEGKESFASDWTLIARIEQGFGCTLSSDSATVGEMLSAIPNADYGSVQWQWYRGDEAISGATDADYTASVADAGAVLRVQMRCGNLRASAAVEVRMFAPTAEVDYERETIAFTTPAALQEGWSIVVSGETGSAANRAWPADESRAEFALAELGIDPDSHAFSAPDYEVSFCLRDASGAEGATARVKLPVRAAFSGKEAEWGDSYYEDPVTAVFVYENEQNMALSLSEADAPDLKLGEGPIFGKLKENTVYWIWMQDRAVQGESFASEWKHVNKLKTQAVVEITATVSSSAVWHPTKRDGLTISYSDKNFDTEAVTVGWYKPNGNKLSGYPTEAGNYIVKLTLSEEAAKWYKLKESEFDFTLKALVMNAKNTRVACESLTYNGQEQLPKRMKVIVDGVELPATEYTVGKLKSQNYSNAGTPIATVTGKNNVSGAISVMYRIVKAKPPAIVWPSASRISKGQSLSASRLTGGSLGLGSFAWQNQSTTPGVGISRHNVVFTPKDTANYDWSSTETVKGINVTVIATASSGSSGSYSGSHGSSYNYSSDYDSDEEIVWESEEERIDFSEVLTGAYLHGGESMEGEEALQIVCDGVGRFHDYELLPVLRYPALDQAAAAMMTPEEYAQAAAPNHMLLVIVHYNDGEAPSQRTLRLTLAQLEYLYNEMGFTTVQFRNGDAEAMLSLEEVFGGDVCKLAAYMNTMKDEVDSLVLDLEEMEDAELDADALMRQSLEIRISPDVNAEGKTAWNMSVWLVNEYQEIEISSLTPSFSVRMDADGLSEEAEETILEQYAIVRVDAQGDAETLETSIVSSPDKLPMDELYECEYFRVDMPDDETQTVFTEYVDCMDIQPYRRTVLACAYAGAGSYQIMELEETE